MRLLGLNKGSFSDWSAKLPEGSTMVVQPKIDGCPIGLRYKYGQLVDAYTRDSQDLIENIRLVKTIPMLIDQALKVEVELEGVLYTPSFNPLSSGKTEIDNLIPLINSRDCLAFLAYQIFYSNSDELSDLSQLQKWGFEVPITLRTDDPRQVERWHSQWMDNELF